MGFFANAFTWWNGASWGTMISSRRNGEEVGRDEAGNIYFRHRKDPSRRWVIYSGSNDSSNVPPGWNAWLRGTIADVPDKALPPRRSFEREPGLEPERLEQLDVRAGERVRPAHTHGAEHCLAGEQRHTAHGVAPHQRWEPGELLQRRGR